MADMVEAGRKADAHRVRNLYRGEFASPAKMAARELAIDALIKAGGTAVLDLWGGGESASAMVAAGLHVISVDNGSMEITDRGAKVTALRKRRALELAAAEGGYAARWGKAADFARECDVAFLDFCGPWSTTVRRTLESCRHMRAIVVTLMTDHDAQTAATTQAERREAYDAWIRMAMNGQTRSSRGRIAGSTIAAGPYSTRRRPDYTRSGGQPVWVYLIVRGQLDLGHVPYRLRKQFDPKWRETFNERRRVWRKSPEQRAKSAEESRLRNARIAADPDLRARRNAAAKERYHRSRLDPEWWARTLADARRRHVERKHHDPHA